jgi:SOS response regulatory protein OraA/RecX
MSPDGEHLAPVTSLFGRRPVGEPVAGAGKTGGPGARATGDSGWAAAEDATAGADETDETTVTESAAIADAEASEASRGRHPAGKGRAERDPWSSAPGRRDGTAKPEAEERKLVALPTYAAFAARSEPDASALGDTRAAGHVGDADEEPEAETTEAARDRAENISLHALTRRGVSSVEMAKTLRSRDLPEEVVLDEVERLERVGLLDDTALAENLVRSKQERKGLGKSAINAELRQRGLAQEAIEAALAEIDDDEEQTRADGWAVKRAGQLRGLDQATAERRLNAFLMRRGYRSEVVRRAVEKALPRGGGSGGVRFR